LLLWPLDLSADYNPQVIPTYSGLSLAAVAGLVVVVGVLCLTWWCRRRSPAITFAGVVAALALAPTSNLLHSAGVVLAERTLYLPVLLVATGAGIGIAVLAASGRRLATVAVGAVVAGALGVRTLDRLPAWRDNRTFLLTLLEEHPESYRAHESAAAVYAGLGDARASQREYAVAESLFAGDPHLDAAYALVLFARGDTTTALPLAARAAARVPDDRVVLRCRFLTALLRRDLPTAQALADTAGGLYPAEQLWYRLQLH
jgi:hypothetical protein